MALVVSSLISDLEDLFSDPPSTFEGCATAWASSMADYSALLTPPLLAPPVSAQAVMEVELTSAFASAAGAGREAAAESLEVVWRTFAVSLGALIAPPFSSSPAQVPPLNVGFLELFTRDSSAATHHSSADDVARKIHAWMLTGTSTNTSSGATVPWS